jgi:hypothetical protein
MSKQLKERGLVHENEPSSPDQQSSGNIRKDRLISLEEWIETYVRTWPIDLDIRQIGHDLGTVIDEVAKATHHLEKAEELLQHERFYLRHAQRLFDWRELDLWQEQGGRIVTTTKEQKELYEAEAKRELDEADQNLQSQRTRTRFAEKDVECRELALWELQRKQDMLKRMQHLLTKIKEHTRCDLHDVNPDPHNRLSDAKKKPRSIEDIFGEDK